MVQFTKRLIKDIGLQREVEDALPYAVVGGAWEASFASPLFDDNFLNVWTHLVPSGQQLKILFLRVFTQEAGGARFGIFQTNPTSATTPLLSGSAVTWPAVENTPTGWRDYPKLEAAGAEVMTGSLHDPVHVLEGSIEFRVLSRFPGAEALAAAGPATGAQYSLVWWGVEKVPEPHR